MALQIDEHPTVVDFWRKAVTIPPVAVNSPHSTRAGCGDSVSTPERTMWIGWRSSALIWVLSVRKSVPFFQARGH